MGGGRDLTGSSKQCIAEGFLDEVSEKHSPVLKIFILLHVLSFSSTAKFDIPSISPGQLLYYFLEGFNV